MEGFSKREELELTLKRPGALWLPSWYNPGERDGLSKSMWSETGTRPVSLLEHLCCGQWQRV